MAPPRVSPSSPRHLTTSFLNGAISSAASPLQTSFNLTCRSPIRPSPEAESRRGGEDNAGHGSSPYLDPRITHAIGAKPQARHTVGEALDDERYNEDDVESQDGEDTSTDRSRLLGSQSSRPDHRVLEKDDGKLGVISAINIIVGRTIGVGAYSVPSAVFAGVGSVGMTLVVWTIGSLISFCGLAVYLDLGSAIPRSGGERVYLERIFRRPHMLATCMFMAYVVLLGFSTPNAIVLGEYALYAVDVQANRWNVRVIAVGAVSLLCYIHAKHPKLGLRLINVLGVSKMLILAVVILAGVAGGLTGLGSDHAVLESRRLEIDLSSISPPAAYRQSTAQRNFSDIWAGSSTQPYDYATALLKVIYCFRGYSTANQVLSDVKNPVRTLKIAAPVALTLISLAYLAINIAFFLVVEKEEFKSAGVVAAGLFFRNVFGPGAAAHILPFFVIVSAAGNIAAASFAQARVNEELAKDGLLPWSGFWTTTPQQHRQHQPYYHSRTSSLSRLKSLVTTAPSSAPTPPAKGLLLHWLVSAAVIILPPPGRIYNFLVSLGGYPVSVLSVAVSAGLLYLRRGPPSRGPGGEAPSAWSSPCRAPALAVIIFAVSNCLLLVLPWVPPAEGSHDAAAGDEARFAWFAYPATALAVLATGAAWWVWWRYWGAGSRTASGRLESDMPLLVLGE